MTNNPPPVNPARRRFLGQAAAASGVVLTGGLMTPSESAAAGTASSASGAGARLTPTPRVVGSGMPMVGYNLANYLPGSNTSAWVEYSRINTARFFCSPSQYAPDSTVDAGTDVSGVDEFDAAIAKLRANPTSERFIRWTTIRRNFDDLVYQSINSYKLTYLLDELVRLQITPIAEVYELEWGGDWASLWREWQKHYAMTFLMARHHGVMNFQFINEPDHPAVLPNIASQDIYIQGLQIASNAIRAAIADVNRLFYRRLRSRIYAPIIVHSANSQGNYDMEARPGGDARDDEHGWGEIALRNMRTDYHGKTVDEDLFDVYDTHLYGKDAAFYAGEIEMIRNKTRQYNPTGEELPIIYTEFNRQNTSGFAALPDDLNTPEVVEDIAEIWGTTLSAGVQGMIAFKFENTVGSSGKPYKTGFYYVDPEGRHDIRGATKSAEMNRMFARGFAGAQLARLHTVLARGDTEFNGWIVHDRARHCYRVWAPHPSGEAAYPITVDLNRLSLSGAGAPPVTIEEVGAVHSGDIVSLHHVPDSRRIRITQGAGTVWMMTIPDRLVRGQDRVNASADAFVVGGTHFHENHGQDEVLTVGADSAAGAPAQVTYLRFQHPKAELRRSPRVILQLRSTGTSDGKPLTFSAFAVTDSSWSSSGLTWLDAPHLDRQSLRPFRVGDVVFPAGQLTAPGRPHWVRLDVTDAVRHATGDHIEFMLIRTRTTQEDTGDDGRTASFASREATTARYRPGLMLWTTR